MIVHANEGRVSPVVEGIVVEGVEGLGLPLGNVDGTGRLSDVLALGSIVLRPEPVIGNLLHLGIVEVGGHVVVEVVVVVGIAEINHKLV